MAQNFLLMFEMVAWYSWLLRVAHTDKVEDSSSSATFIEYIFFFLLIVVDDATVVSTCREQTLLLQWRVKILFAFRTTVIIHTVCMNPILVNVNIFITYR